MSTFKDIDIGKISVSKTNPRTEFDSAAINELADSIKSHGLLQPIIVRTMGNRYELISGERRFRACSLIKVKTIACHVKEMTDEEAFEAQIIENLQRKDVNPMDEAAAYQRLLDRPGYNIAEVCLKVGKDAQYIHRRLKLNDLIPKYKKELFEGKIMLAHAMELCRLSPEDQKEAEEYLYEYKDEVATPADLRASILSNIVLILDKAPFDKTDANLVKKMPACTNCPKRSGFNKTLFGDIDKTDRCFNPACFKLKTTATLLNQLKANPDMVPVRSQYSSPADIEKQIKQPTLPSNKFVVVDLPKGGKDCEDSKKALYITGNELGKVVKICCNPKCNIHGKQSASGSATNANTKESKEGQIERVREIKKERSLELLWAEINKYDIVNDPAGLRTSITFKQLFRVALVYSLGYRLNSFFKRTEIGLDHVSIDNLVPNYHKITETQWAMIELQFIQNYFAHQFEFHSLEPLVKDMASHMMIPVEDILQPVVEKYGKREAKLEKELAEIAPEPRNKKSTPLGRGLKSLISK